MADVVTGLAVGRAFCGGEGGGEGGGVTEGNGLTFGCFAFLGFLDLGLSAGCRLFQDWGWRVIGHHRLGRLCFDCHA